AAQAQRTQRRRAVSAGFSLAAIHRQFLLEIPWRAIGRQEVAQGGAAALDRVGKYGADRIGEDAETLAGNAAGGAERVDAGLEQGFGGVDVADPDDDGLVHQEGL